MTSASLKPTSTKKAKRAAAVGKGDAAKAAVFEEAAVPQEAADSKETTAPKEKGSGKKATVPKEAAGGKEATKLLSQEEQMKASLKRQSDDAEEQRLERKKQKLAAFKERKAKAASSQTNALLLADRDPQTQSKHFWGFYEEDVPSTLSQLEREDMLRDKKPVPEQFLAVKNAESWTQVVQECLPEKANVEPQMGVQVLVVCSSALRAVEVIKELQSLKGTKVCKLFARHMKAAEQIEACKRPEFRVGVGTPNRVLKIAEDSALFESLRVVVFDNWLSDKKQTLFSLKDTRKDVWALWDNHISGSTKIKSVIY